MKRMGGVGRGRVVMQVLIRFRRAGRGGGGCKRLEFDGGGV